MSLDPRHLKNCYHSLKKKAAFTLAEGATHVAHSHNIRRVAFTLAEVLTTIGIIGVVAAMTLPTLITQYKRQSAETKLKKFYSVINQAMQMSIAEYGEIDVDFDKNLNTPEHSKEVDDFCKKYITKYLVKIKDERFNENYYDVVFLDGSGFRLYISNDVFYVFYRLNYRTESSTKTNLDGKNEFLFAYSNGRVEPIWKNNSINSLKSNCYQTGDVQRHGCATLIMKNGWKIPDDYPWIK